MFNVSTLMYAESKAVELVDRPFKSLLTIYYTKTIKNNKGEITLIELAPSPFCIILICLVYINVFARFDEILSITLQDKGGGGGGGGGGKG